MRMTLTSFATLAVAGTALVASAQQAGPGPQRHDGGRAGFQQALGLSDEQVTQLRKLRQDDRKQAIRRRADMQIARMELNEALGAPTIDEKVVAAKVQALTQLQSSALRARVDQRLALARILTPEQRAKMQQLRREHGFRNVAHRAWGRGERRFGGGPDGGRRMGPGAPGAAGGGPGGDGQDDLED